jgi:quercetin dioxygenase-like cupin family protein
MKSRQSILLAILMFAVAMMLMTTSAPAQGLPKGVSLKVMAEFPSEIPGIEKIQLLEFRLEPGAKLENFVHQETDFCTAKQGLLTVVAGGTTVVRGPGSRWVCPLGIKLSLYNNGSEPHVHHIWALIPSK